MNTLLSQAGGSSRGASIADLDGYSIPTDYYNLPSNYNPKQSDEFAFDPPAANSTYSKRDSIYSPSSPNDMMLESSWPRFEREEDSKESATMSKSAVQLSELSLGREMDHMISQTLSDSNTVLSRYGQVTPPRSNSATSADPSKELTQVSPHSSVSTRKRRGKAEEKSPPRPTDTATKSGKKRKSNRKSAVTPVPVAERESPASPEDEKRKMSLEKNRLAAAKCRVNKKEKVEHLQRDSHEKSMQNTLLKETVIRMKGEIQQMNAILMVHANSKSCKKPDEIHKALSHLGAGGDDYFAQHHMSVHNQHYGNYASVPRHMQSMTHSQIVRGNYFAQAQADHENNMLANPPLPEYDQSGDFDLETPQPID